MISGFKKKVDFKIRRYLKKRSLQKQYKELKKAAVLSKPLLRSLEFLVYQNVTADDKLVIDKVESLRNKILEFSSEVEIYYSPKPGSVQVTDIENVRPKHGELKTFDAETIAFKASISQFWGTFLYLLSSSHECKSIIELGACAGISGSYLASNPFCEEFITIEGSAPLHHIARGNIQSIKSDAKVILGLFNDALDQVLTDKNIKFDFVWIDGHHEKVATIHYFNRLKPFLSKNALVLFDDISWSQDMFEGWEEIRNDTGFELTINLMGEKGLGIWSGDSLSNRTINFGTDKDKKISIPHGW